MPRIAIQRHYVFVRHTRIPLIIWPTSNGSKGSSKKPLDFTWKRWMYSPISPLLTVIWHLFCSSRVNSTKHWCTTKRRSGMCIQLLYLGRLYNLYRRHAHRDCHGWLIVFVFFCAWTMKNPTIVCRCLQQYGKHAERDARHQWSVAVLYKGHSDQPSFRRCPFKFGFHS